MLLVVAMSMCIVACEDGENVFQQQMDRFVSYMTSRMGLVSEAEAEQSMTGEKLPYYTRCDDAYRHITNVYREDRPQKRIAEGSQVTFRYEAYLFESGPANVPFATNNRGTGALLAAQYGLDTTYWDFTPAVRILGTDPIIPKAAMAISSGTRSPASVKVLVILTAEITLLIKTVRIGCFLRASKI